ncbi:hypothetical protein CHELA1G11_14410 [Hyphomicrobiales bacterium]|nr:hypothetical protein CHELA1G11_14410 [Hyphomicrobiales bacterium]CAH1680388.1 hypothetical protein CHELA1G2_14694 [Hyphomicrobiales bacterium]
MIYGETMDGGSIGITDPETFERAQLIAAYLASLSGLPVHIEC